MKFPLRVLDSYETALDLIAYFPFHDEKRKKKSQFGRVLRALGWLPFTVKVLKKTMKEKDRKLRKLRARKPASG